MQLKLKNYFFSKINYKRDFLLIGSKIYSKYHSNADNTARSEVPLKELTLTTINQKLVYNRLLNNLCGNYSIKRNTFFQVQFTNDA